MESDQKKKRCGAPFVFVPRKISEWAKQSSTNAKVESWKVSGGHSYTEKK